MRGIQNIVSIAIFLVSVCAFLTLHILQWSSGFLVIPYLFIFAFIYCTKKDKRITFKDVSWVELFIITGVLGVGFFVADKYRAITYVSDIIPALGLPYSRTVLLIILAVLALMSVPCLVYTASWLKERSSSPFLQNFSAFLDGKKFYAICSAIAALAIFIMLYYSSSVDISEDESFSLACVESGYSEVIYLTGIDVHPPLYYLILKLFDDLLGGVCGLSAIQIGKIVSVIPCAILVLICLTWVKRFWGSCAAALSAIAICCLPQMLEYGVIVRMYTWTSLFVVCSYMQAWRIKQRNSIWQWLLFALWGLMAVYTHYWGGIAVSFVYLYMLLWSIRKGRMMVLKWCAAVLLSIVGFLPWVMVLVGQINREDGARDIAVLSPSFISDMIFYAGQNLLLIYLALLYFVRNTGEMLKKKRDRFVLLGCFMSAWIIICCFTVILILSLRVTNRYLLPGVVCSWLAISIAIALMKDRRFRFILSVAVVSSCLCSAASFALHESKGEDAVNGLKMLIEQTHPDALFVDQKWAAHTAGYLFPDMPVYSTEKIGELRLKVYKNYQLHLMMSNEEIERLLYSGKKVCFISAPMNSPYLQSELTSSIEKCIHDYSCKLHEIGSYTLRVRKWTVYLVDVNKE